MICRTEIEIFYVNVTCLFVFFVAVNPPPVFSSPLQPTIYDLEISIHYRKKEMLKTTLSTPRLQLHYHHGALELNAHHLCFPSTDGLLDHKQVNHYINWTFCVTSEKKKKKIKLKTAQGTFKAYVQGTSLKLICTWSLSNPLASKWGCN